MFQENSIFLARRNRDGVLVMLLYKFGLVFEVNDINIGRSMGEYYEYVFVAQGLPA